MPTISFELTSGEMTRLVNAICSQHHYQDTINGEANPETKAQFARRTVVDFLKDKVHTYERALAIQQAEAGLTEVTIV